jgi:hypothetical protein
VLRPGSTIETVDGEAVVNKSQVPGPGFNASTLTLASTPAPHPAFAFNGTGTDFWAYGLNLGVEFRY